MSSASSFPLGPYSGISENLSIICWTSFSEGSLTLENFSSSDKNVSYLFLSKFKLTHSNLSFAPSGLHGLSEIENSSLLVVQLGHWLRCLELEYCLKPRTRVKICDIRILDLVDQNLSKFDDFGVVGKLTTRSIQILWN